MDLTSHNILIDVANIDDCDFLAHATISAERAHTGCGIWDILLGDNKQIHEKGYLCLAEIARNNPRSHLYYDRFLVARTQEGVPIACCSGYTCAETSLGNTLQLLEHEAARYLNWTKSVYEEHLNQINFLNTSWPEEVSVDNVFILETIYTDLSWRGKGISSQLIRKCLEKGKSIDGIGQFMVLGAVGNHSALHVYRNIGFRPLDVIYQSPECLEALGTPGFQILVMDVTDFAS